MPTVSIIVPVYNVAPYVDACLKSIAGQVFRDFEVIVVDDGSTDGSGHICDAWAARDSRFIVVHQQNCGLSAARNVGLDMAKGEYVQFVDSDDRVGPRYTDALVRYARETGCGCVICGHLCERESVRYTTTPSPELVLMSARDCVRSVLEARSEARYRVACGVWVHMFRRSVFDEGGVRFPEGRVFEDVSVLVPTIRESGLVALVSDVLYYKHDRPESITWEMSAQKARDYLDAYKTLREEVARSCPDMLPMADNLLERARIVAWLRLARDARAGDDEAEAALRVFQQEAVRGRGDLRLPGDMRYVLALLGIVVVPGVTRRAYVAWRR